MLTLDQITPVKDQVLVVPDPVKAISDGGIHIPETVRADNPNYYTMTGVVVKVGLGAFVDGERKPVAVQAGDRVVFGRYAGKQIEVHEAVFWPDAHDPILAAIQNHDVLWRSKRVLMLREPEIIGKTDGEYIEPGYQAARHRPIKGTARPAESAYDGPSAMVIK